ncbi:UNVERIFIED_CONTAM: FT-interacting protein 4 [Sesamum angustifolium]|uniref:FT-interacting protein 4 n=1 Tax=Sesamum angustifolium TaxID=2727405 RepID=A0AAW2RI79_9LAMI
MGEIQLAVRFSCASLSNMLLMYSQPLLPNLHYSHPLSCHQIEILRHQATQIVSTRLSRSEPPLRKEVVEYMLDVGSNLWSVRRSKANHYRIAGILSAIVKVIKWFNQIRTWNSPFITVLVHILFLAFVCFPWMILSTIFLYLFLIGTWNYRGRPRHPPHMEVKLSQADTALNDELDEEFDTFPTSQKQIDILKMRYDRLRAIASRVQTVLGDMATQGERFYNLLSWRSKSHRPVSHLVLDCFCTAIYNSSQSCGYCHRILHYEASQVPGPTALVSYELLEEVACKN